MSGNDASAPIRDVTATLHVTRRLSPNHVLLTFRAPNIATAARAGQFVHLRVSPSGTSPLLRRPFSVARVNLADGTIRILVRTIGRGTEMLADLLPGTELSALGPLGRPFPEISSEREVVMVAGGVGVAPLLCYAADRPGRVRTVLHGAETGEALALRDDLAESCDQVFVATDNGSEGHHGFVTDLLPKVLDGLSDSVVLACGPRPMMAKTADECSSRGIECYVSFEAWLGCGVGACLGCVIPAAGEPTRYLRVCRDGPVFNADEVGWDMLR